MGWRASSHCAGGECVQVTSIEGPDGLAVLVRDSANLPGPVLALSPEAWSALISCVRAGDGA